MKYHRRGEIQEGAAQKSVLSCQDIPVAISMGWKQWHNIAVSARTGLMVGGMQKEQ